MSCIWWFVYERPFGYEARRLENWRETGECRIGVDLDDVRAKLPAGLYGPIVPMPDDAPEVKEGWLGRTWQ
jgi:hypothetical protein